MKIAVFTKNLTNPAYAAARLGADRAASTFGAQTLHFVPEVPDDPAQQSALIAQALDQAPDAFVLAPVHPTLVNPAIQAIVRAGIPIVSFINRVEDAPCVAHVGSDDARLATDVAEYLFKQMRGQGKLVLIEGPPASPSSTDRVRAFRLAAQRYPGLQVVAAFDGGYQREPARTAFADVAREQAQIDAVLAANDVMALGALDVLTSTGRRALVAGVNAIPEAIAAIKSGTMLVTADFNAMQICFLATECAIRHVRGQTVPQDISLPVEVVDASNCDRWDLPYEQRNVITLAELRQQLT